MSDEVPAGSPAPDASQTRRVVSERVVQRECEACGGSFEAAKRGRPAKYCSPPCRQRGWALRQAERALGTAEDRRPQVVREVVERVLQPERLVPVPVPESAASALAPSPTRSSRAVRPGASEVPVQARAEQLAERGAGERRARTEGSAAVIRRRDRASGGRPLSVRVSLSLEEAALIRAAAVRAGVADAAWLGEAGVRAAVLVARPGAVDRAGQMQQLMGLRAELMDARRLLRNIGGNLNDVAVHANSTGDIHAAARRVIERVERSVAGVEATVKEVDAATADVRKLLLEERRAPS